MQRAVHDEDDPEMMTTAEQVEMYEAWDEFREEFRTETKLDE